MAKPINPTPKLDSKSSRDFRIKMAACEKSHVGPIPTPRLDNVIRTIMADARKDKE